MTASIVLGVGDEVGARCSRGRTAYLRRTRSRTRRPLLSSTVMTPSLPTLSITSAIRSPISRSCGGDGGDVGDFFLGVDLDGHACGCASTTASVAASMPRLSSIGLAPAASVLQAFGDDGLGQHGGGGGAVAGDVVGLGGGFLEQLGAHVLVRVFQFDFLGHGHAVVGDGGGAEFLVQRHVAALGAEGGGHRVRRACPCRSSDARRASSENTSCLAAMVYLLLLDS